MFDQASKQASKPSKLPDPGEAARASQTANQTARQPTTQIKQAFPFEIVEQVFFIPAQRSLLISDGWPQRFERFRADTPVVARSFSDHLVRLLDDKSRRETALYPSLRFLKEPLRRLVDEAIFHGGRVHQVASQMQRRLELSYEGSAGGLPFMTWTAGQREFTPLLFGLYSLLPKGPNPTRIGVDWVVIEEPEMGLHPKAIVATMLLVLELLRRKYRVVISTHSPTVLDVVWGIRQLKGGPDAARALERAFQVRPRHDLADLFEAGLAADIRVHALNFTPAGRVRSQDITELDPDSRNAQEQTWGGLVDFTRRMGDEVMAQAARK